MSQILALDATQIVLIVLIGLLVIAYPLLMLRRNKKENQRMTEQTNSLKRGDKILTASGVYGKIVDIKLDGNAKQVTIETGTDKYKSYMTVDAYAIYQVIKDEPQVAKDVPAPAAPVEAKPVEAKPVEKKAKEEKAEPVVAEQKPEQKAAKPRAKKVTEQKPQAQPEQKAEAKKPAPKAKKPAAKKTTSTKKKA